MLKNELMPTSAAARRLGMSRQNILYLVSQGELSPAMKLPAVNGAYLFETAEVERVADLRAKKTETAK